MATVGRKLLWGGLVTAVVLGLAELGVRAWAPANKQALISPLTFQQDTSAISSPGPIAQTKHFGGPGVVTRSEPAGVRIFFFGGSATEGFHMSPWSNFAGWYQRLLRMVVPDIPIEIINLGAGGVGSRQVLQWVRSAAQTETADLFVVYSGNNEYYELRALKASNPSFSVRSELARRRVSGLHLYRWLRDWLRPPGDRTSLARTTIKPVDSLTVEIDADERALGVMLYREHMAEIIATAKAAKMPLMLSTVADHRMSYAVHGPPPTPSPGVAAGLSALASAGGLRNPQAVEPILARLDKQLKTEGDYFEVGRLLHRDQLFARARPYFVEAEYLDPKPRRSNRAMRAGLRDLATRTDTPVCDASALLDARAHRGLAGDEFFLDPCHPTPKGHRALAEILLNCTLSQGLLPSIGDNQAALQRLRALMTQVPLKGKDIFRLDHFTERRAQLHENRAMTDAEVLRVIRSFDDGTAAGAARSGHHAMLFHRPKAALTWYGRAVERGGALGALHLSRGLVLTTLGDIAGAQEAFRRATVLLPNDTETRQHLTVLEADL